MAFCAPNNKAISTANISIYCNAFSQSVMLRFKPILKTYTYVCIQGYMRIACGISLLLFTILTMNASKPLEPMSFKNAINRGIFTAQHVKVIIQSIGAYL
ncbi:unnamed protein product [Ceratitis capitata]|uniref:(Mediterranean fruit fly) hypothetical protein n=1 Tax=Ceratitis capitata TaxID=7213 RepID=A0A811V6L3_CERCA|nr:unnamed protein product [Ceratitis capitata]